MLVLEDGQDYCAEKMCSLLDYMATTTVLTRDQIMQVSVGGTDCSVFSYIHCDCPFLRDFCVCLTT